MSCGCCSTNTDKSPTRIACPECASQCRRVEHSTVRHWLIQPWRRTLESSDFYFCANPDCHQVYVSADGPCFSLEQLRGPVGQKQRNPERTLCYCYGVTAAESADPDVRAFVEQQTANGDCACSSRNPSGRCCLSDFPKPS